MSRHRKLANFVDETRARQRNIVFPETVRNLRSATAFLWNGSTNPPLVQRVGAWILGSVWMIAGMWGFSLAVQMRVDDGFSGTVVVMIAMAAAAGFVGIKIFRNGFPRHAKTGEVRKQSH
jgi:hypothetical protein